MNVYTLPRKHSDRARSSLFDRVPASLFQSVRSCPPSNVGYSAWEQTIRAFRASALPLSCSDKKEWMPRHGCRLRFSRSLAIMARSSCRACAGSSGRAAYYYASEREYTYIKDHCAAGSGLCTYILLHDLRVLLPLALSAPPGLGHPPPSDLYRDAFALTETWTTLRAGPALCICTPRHRSRRQRRCGRSQSLADQAGVVGSAACISE
jgi:hypothetical protein